MRRSKQLARQTALALQVVAAALWILPQSAFAAPVLLFPLGDTVPLIRQMAGTAVPGSALGEARIYLAQTSGGGQGGSGSQSTSSDRDPDTGPQAVTEQATANIIRQFTDASDFCRLLELRYRIDCLHAQFSKIAQTLPQTGDYAPLRAALTRATNRLEDVVDSYEEPYGQKIRPRLKSQPTAARIRPLSPIRPEKQAAANQATAAVITELSTVLLRSAQGSERRQLAFQEIATAIDSTRILLRST